MALDETCLANSASTRSSKSSPVPYNDPRPRFHLIFDLPIELRTLIWEYAVSCDYIQYYHRARLAPGDAALIYPFPDHIRDLSIPRPRFQVVEPRKGHSRFRNLRTLLPLLLVSRLVYAEAAPLLWKTNVFYISSQDLVLFAGLLPASVRAVVKKIGILNNGMLGAFNSNFSALQQFPALEQIVFVPRGGIADSDEMQSVVDAVKEYSGREYKIVKC